MIDPDHERQRLTGRVMDLKPPGQRPPAWSCACGLPKHKRHTEPAQCVAQTEVEAWRWANPEATVSDRGAKALLWMQQTFGGR